MILIEWGNEFHDWFAGGHAEFQRHFPQLCESNSVVASSPMMASPYSASSMPVTPSRDVDSHPATQILPFLYLGNGRDASDLETLTELKISRVLNVTADLPGFHQTHGILYKQLPAADSGQQNLRQYFDEAHQFIGKHPLPFPSYYFPSHRPVDLSTCPFSSCQSSGIIHCGRERISASFFCFCLSFFFPCQRAMAIDFLSNFQGASLVILFFPPHFLFHFLPRFLGPIGRQGEGMGGLELLLPRHLAGLSGISAWARPRSHCIART